MLSIRLTSQARDVLPANHRIAVPMKHSPASKTVSTRKHIRPLAGLIAGLVLLSAAMVIAQEKDPAAPAEKALQAGGNARAEEMRARARAKIDGALQIQAEAARIRAETLGGAVKAAAGVAAKEAAKPGEKDAAKGNLAEEDVVQVAPGGNVRVEVNGQAIEIQGGAIQMNGGNGVLPFQFGNGRVQIGGGAVGVANANAGAAKPSGPSMIFTPAFPFHPLPNPETWKFAKTGYLGLRLDGPAQDAGAEPKPAGAKKDGVTVNSVAEGSPSEKAGVQGGDRVMKFDGKEVGDADELRGMIRAARAGTIVKLAVKRGDKDIELKAELAVNPFEIAQAAQAQGIRVFGNREPQAVPGVVTFAGRNSAANTRTASGTAGSADKDIIRLRDGNRFTGSITGFDPARGVIFERSGAATLELIEDGIENIAFADRTKGAEQMNKATLQLLDGSWFSGESLTMDGGKITLALNEAARLEFPRGQAQSITLSDGTAPQIYEGPGSLAGWSSGRNGGGQWVYADGWLRCVNNGAIGRDFGQMPDPIDLSFEVNYPPHMQHFSVTLFSPGINQSGPGTLTLQFGPNQISGNHFDGKRTNQYRADLPQPKFGGAMKAETRSFRILVDRVEGRALIYSDGEKRAEWKLSKVKAADMPKTGGTFSITSQVFTPEHKFGLGKVRVMPWDGKEPGKGGGPAELIADRVLTSARTTTDGEIERITEKEVQIAGQPAVARQGTVFMRFTPRVKPDALPKSAGTVRLRNGSEFTVTSVKGEGGTLTVTTRFGSQFTLPLEAFDELSLLPRDGDPQDPAKELDLLTLTDATQLKGTLVTPVADGKLQWKIAASREPLTFGEKDVAGVFLSQTRKPDEAAALSGTAVIRLANGDWLPGEIISLDDRRIVVKNSLAHDLAFSAESLRSIFLSQDVIASMADGSTGSELWSKGRIRNGYGMNTVNFIGMQSSSARTQQANGWVYHDGSYIVPKGRGSGGGLSKKWPAYAGNYAIHFEIEGSNRSNSFNVQIMNSRQEQTFSLYSYGGGQMQGHYQGRGADAARGGGMKQFQFQDKVLANAAKIEVTLVLDRNARAFRAFVNGKEAGKIVFKPEQVQAAFDLASVNITPSFGGGGDRASRVANLWIGPWEGAGPQTADPAGEKPNDGANPAGSAEPRPVIHLANGDEFSGKLLALTADELKADSEAGPLELPRDRVAWVRFPGAAPNNGGHYPRLRFHDRGVLSVTDLVVDAEKVKCRTLQGQAIEFPLSVVKEVVWRPVP